MSNESNPLDKIKLNPEDIPDDAPDPKLAEEIQQLDEYKQVEIQKLRTEIEGLKQDIGERKKYANKIFRLICIWLICVFLVLILVGFDNEFTLSDNVILALIGGTTTNVLGIFIIVANYLFPKP